MGEDAPKYDIEPGWLKRMPQPWRGLVMAGAGLYLLVALAGGIWAVGEFFVALADGDSADIRNVGIIFLAAMGAPLVIWRAFVAQGNLDRSRDRDYADLFTKAVEQLGATREVRVWKNVHDEETQKIVLREVSEQQPNIEVRLGAIYALERISQDSERDHIAVMETLCAYVRENAPGKECKDIEYSLIPDNGKDIFNITNKFQRPRREIISSRKVLTRRGINRIHFELNPKRDRPIFRLDLRTANLRASDLRGARLQYGMLMGARLEGALLSEANLRFADLRSACLIGARVSGADFTFSKISKANLSHAVGFTPEILEHTFGCSETVLPRHLEAHRPKHWPDHSYESWYDMDNAYRDWIVERDGCTESSSDTDSAYLDWLAERGGSSLQT